MAIKGKPFHYSSPRGHTLNNTMGVECKKASSIVDENNTQVVVL